MKTFNLKLLNETGTLFIKYFVCLAIVLLSSTVFGQINVPPVVNHQISFQVKRQATRATSKTNWQTEWGSSDKDTYRQLTVAIEIRNVNKTNDSFTVNWFFLSRSLNNRALKIFDSGNEYISLQSTESKKLLKQSKEIMSNNIVFATEGSSTKTGEKLEGYIVTLTDKDGKPFAFAASSHPLEELAKNTEKMNQLIDKSMSDEK